MELEAAVALKIQVDLDQVNLAYTAVIVILEVEVTRSLEVTNLFTNEFVPNV